VPESLKNMLLVMSTSGVINPPGTTSPPTSVNSKQPVELWDVTWEKVDKFLPKLKDELFPTPPPQSTENSINVAINNNDSNEIVANIETTIDKGESSNENTLAENNEKDNQIIKETNNIIQDNKNNNELESIISV
jgi:hypothetical protein